ncbi:hypothetical protein RND81_14G116400 [Saponaria officinalis]|uniref:Uncharacterized protein n=1 Tax=Saponaria officinalis TaxID=3572 RepID=A0AAW1GKN7_SAPOF
MTSTFELSAKLNFLVTPSWSSSKLSFWVQTWLTQPESNIHSSLEDTSFTSVTANTSPSSVRKQPLLPSPTTKLVSPLFSLFPYFLGQNRLICPRSPHLKHFTSLFLEVFLDRDLSCFDSSSLLNDRPLSSRATATVPVLSLRTPALSFFLASKDSNAACACSIVMVSFPHKIVST